LRGWSAIVAALLGVLAGAPMALAASVSLYVGQNPVTGLPPPIVQSGGLLIPAAILPYIGGEIVDLSGASVRFRSQGREVVVQAGQSTALVNGSGVGMGATAVSEHDTLFVPLRFVADIQGLRVAWEQEKAAIRLSERVVPSEIPTPAPLPSPVAVEPALPVPVPAPRPEPQASGAASPQPVAPPAELVTPVAAAARTPSPAPPDDTGTRAWTTKTGSLVVCATEHAGSSVFELRGVDAKDLSISLLSAPSRLVIDMSSFVPEIAAPPWELEHPAVARVRLAPFRGKGRMVLDLHQPVGYELEEYHEGVRLRLNRVLSAVEFTPSLVGGQLIFDLPAQAPFHMERVGFPDRVVIDLPGTSLVGGPRVLEQGTGPVKAVRVSQYTPHTTRVVLDVAGELSCLPFVVPGPRLQFTLQNEIGSIGMADIGAGRKMILVEGVGPMEAKLFTLHSPDRLVVDISHAWVRHPFGKLAGDGLVRELRAAQFAPGTVRVVIELGGPVEAGLVHFQEQGMLGVLLEPPTLLGSRVVVDAGHGGDDPGAIGRVLGLRESDINLDIATRLAALLAEAEADVFSLRADDSHVFLGDRPLLAAEYQPDVLVSIHANSAPPGKEDATGTETIYWCSDSSYDLARALQEEVTGILGTVDRGTKQRALLVLREASVPAALVEVAFISGRTDEELLADPSFRHKAAQGIFNGVLRFLRRGGESGVLVSAERAKQLWQALHDAPNRVYLPPEQAPAGAVVAVASKQGVAVVEQEEIPQVAGIATAR
jgi:N-acetylmuramoyl-L-alanine amidase